MPQPPASITMGVLANPTRHLFFTGKGGVGKTTLACAVAGGMPDTHLGVVVMTPIRVILSVFWLSISPAMAQDTNTGRISGMDHSAMMAGILPKESGQSAFATIQEIVTILENDPSTDWSSVNIEALRQHLIDMNNVMMESVVATAEQASSISFAVSGNGPVRGSIQRMVSAHVAAMNGVNGWQLTAQKTPTGATLTVSSAEAASLPRLRGLGFIGVLAMGMHHQMHHLMIAKGMSPHT